MEQRALTKDGWRWLAWSDRAVLDGDSNVVAIIGVGREITERKQAEKEQERLQKELEQARKMEAVGQLTGGIAHDFNNILGIIMGNIEIMLNRYGSEVPEKAVKYLETAMKASEQAKNLVAQMLTFSRSGKEALELFKEKPNEFALVITDQTMPGITGIEVVKTLRKARPDLPVILNTGFSEDIDENAAAKMGIRYLTKPVRAERMIQAVGDLLRPAEQSTE